MTCEVCGGVGVLRKYSQDQAIIAEDTCPACQPVAISARHRVTNPTCPTCGSHMIGHWVKGRGYVYECNPCPDNHRGGIRA